jgi:hypothetical protein
VTIIRRETATIAGDEGDCQEILMVDGDIHEFTKRLLSIKGMVGHTPDGKEMTKQRMTR